MRRKLKDFDSCGEAFYKKDATRKFKRGWKSENVYGEGVRVEETRRRPRLDTYVGISPGSLMSVNGT